MGTTSIGMSSEFYISPDKAFLAAHVKIYTSLLKLSSCCISLIIILFSTSFILSYCYTDYYLINPIFKSIGIQILLY